MHKHVQPTMKEKKTLKHVLRRFANETSAPGWPRLIDRPGFASKAVWFVFLVLALSVFVYQTVKLLQDYHTFNTKINLINSQEVVFPAVTVCNLNRMKKSSLANDTRWAASIYQDDRKQPNYLTIFHDLTNVLPPYNPGVSSTADPFTPLPPTPANHSDITNSSTESQPNDTRTDKGDWGQQRDRRAIGGDDYQWSYDSLYEEEEEEEIEPVNFFHDLGLSLNGSLVFFASPRLHSDAWQAPDIDIPEPTKEDLRDMGHQFEEFVLDCKFNNRKCDFRDFTITQRKHYGNCFTFNGDTTNSSNRIRVTKAGSHYGLHLTMFIDHDEYVGFLTEESGIRVMAHQRDIMPHPEDVGMSVAPGVSTNIALRQVEIKRLPDPYGNCTPGNDGLRYLGQGQYSYSLISCQKKCLLDQLVADCGCVTDIYDEFDSLPQCNRTQRVCRQLVEKLYYQNLLECHCPTPCQELVYNTQITSSVWPTDSSFVYLKDELFDKSPGVYYKLGDVFTARENLARIKVYFQELNYELVEQVPANSIPSILGTIGGLLGLYIGFSLITFGEIIVLVYHILSLPCKRTP